MTKKILFIRRDNIGDLLCTTPAIRAVRAAYPDARIDLLVNSYNADAVCGNPDIDNLYIYEKSKHVSGGQRFLAILKQLHLIFSVRRVGYDFAIGCGGYSPTLERFTLRTGAKQTVGFLEGTQSSSRYSDPVVHPGNDEHEVERICRLIRPLGVEQAPGPMVLSPLDDEVDRFKAFLEKDSDAKGLPLVAVSISARQRKKWPLERYASLIQEMISDGSGRVLLLWAPGSADNPTFPGDDEGARELIHRFGDDILAYPTSNLKQLIAAAAQSSVIVTPDGGLLHMAAALGKPTVALMPVGNVSSWYPWKVESEILSNEEGVARISVEEVFGAVKKVLNLI